MDLPVVFLSVLVTIARAAELHVDQEGTMDGSFRDVFAAQVAARDLVRQGDAPVEVVVHGVHALPRTLTLDLRDRGTTWRGATPGSSIHGGVQVPASHFTTFKNTSRGPIMMADLALFPTLNVGTVADGCATSRNDLYLNGERMVLARYPNINSEGFYSFALTTGGSSTVLEVDDTIAKRVPNWIKDGDVWLHGYWKFDWADNYIKIASFDGQHTITRDPTTPFRYDIALKNARYYALNSLSELDAQGEFYIDRTARYLYFLPPRPLLPADVIMISNLEVVLSANNTSGVAVEGLDIKYGKHTNVHWNNVTSSSMKHCDLGGSGGTAVEYSNCLRACNTQFMNNTVEHTGCSGFTISAGDYSTLERGNVVVEGNVIRKFSSWMRTYQPALSFAGVGNVYRGNVLHDGPHTAAQGGGNDNLFEGNTFNLTNYETNDGGSWYAGRTWAKRNNTLINNLFMNVRNIVPCHLGYPQVQAIYNDDELSGNTFVNNTFVDCDQGLFIGGGRSHVAHGNTFIRVAVPFHIDDRGLHDETRCKPYSGTFWKELQSLNYTHPPYSTHYPALMKIADNKPCAPAGNVVENNRWCGAKAFTPTSAAQIAAWGSLMRSNEELPSSQCQYPPQPPPNPHAMCTWTVQWQRDDNKAITEVTARAYGNATFAVKGCHVQPSKVCVDKYKIKAGARTLVNTADMDSVVAFTVCCNDVMSTVVSAMYSNCSVPAP